MSVTWDPQQYATFAGHRDRPFFDLTARVDARAPEVVVDLGCGNGPLTLGLARRWPGARVIGVDSSPQMIERARELDEHDRVEWVRADLTSWRSDTAVDVLVMNAALQWVPDHLALLPDLLARLAPGGWFAMQVPGNFDAPSHRLLREVAARSPRADELVPRLRGATAVGEPAAYAAVLAGAGFSLDVWETTYQQVLDPQGQQADPVLEWTKGTALRPVLEVLTDEAERADFLREYADELARAYPRQRFGTLFPFRRIFAVGHTSASGGAVRGAKGGADESGAQGGHVPPAGPQGGAAGSLRAAASQGGAAGSLQAAASQGGAAGSSESATSPGPAAAGRAVDDPRIRTGYGPGRAYFPAPGPVTGLHHVQVSCPAGSEEALRRFYVGVLGMTEVAKPPVLAARGGAWFRSGAAELHCGVEPDFRPARKAHPCLLVDDVDAVAEAVRRAGGEVRWDDNVPGVRRFHTDDSVGNRMELQQV